MNKKDLEQNTVCIIPARGRSPVLPKKNIKRIDEKPLVAHSIDTVVDCSAMIDVFVSTESKRIAKIAKDHGARVPFMRPDELSADDVSIRPVIQHALTQISELVDDVTITPQTPVIILQPNVPFRRPTDIFKCIKAFKKSGDRSVISVTEENGFFWRRKNNDELSPMFSTEDRLHDDTETILNESGSITVTRAESVRTGEWPGRAPWYIITDQLSSFRVDNLVDFWIAEKIAAGPSILFRTEGGGDLGLGKVYRAVTLASKLEKIFNCNIHFISNISYEDGVEFIRSHGFDVDVVENTTEDIETVQQLDPDIVFVDLNRTDETYLDMLHQLSAAVVNFENMYDGDEPADFVINPQRNRDMIDQENYLNGPEYLILRDEIREITTEIAETAENILLTFGGTDPLGLTIKCLRSLGGTDLGFNYRVIIGPGFSYNGELNSLPDEILSRFDFYRDVDNIGEFMKWADIAITGGGRTAYELAATGTPSIVIAQNSGEIKRMRLLREQGAIVFLGHGAEANFEAIPQLLRELARDTCRRSVLSERGQELVDGQGLQRIVSTIEKMFIDSN